MLSALRPRHEAYATLSLPDHSALDASLEYVIAGWPVICPLYRFRFAKEFNRQDISKRTSTTGAPKKRCPQTILDQGSQENLPPILMLLKADDKNHPLEMQRGGAIDVHTFDGLPEHRMTPSASQPQTIRLIDTITAFIHRQTAQQTAA